MHQRTKGRGDSGCMNERKGPNQGIVIPWLSLSFPALLLPTFLWDGEGEEGKESGNQGKVLTPERCLISSSPSTPDTDRNQATPGSALHSFLSPHYFLLLASDGEEEERKLKPIKRKCGGEGRYEGTCSQSSSRIIYWSFGNLGTQLSSSSPVNQLTDVWFTG